jgi:hypothetical protein
LLNQNQQINFVLKPESIISSQIEVVAERKNDNITNTEIGVEKLNVREIKKIPVLFGEQDVLKMTKPPSGIKKPAQTAPAERSRADILKQYGL